MFAEDELAQLRGFAEPARAELIRYFTLAAGDKTFVLQLRGRANVLDAAVQLCTLPRLPACGSRHPSRGPRPAPGRRSRSACSRRHAARDTRRQAAIRSVIATLTPCPVPPVMFSKLDGLTLFLAPLLPAPDSDGRANSNDELRPRTRHT